MARKAPKGRPAWVPGWIYTVCLHPRYPAVPFDNGHQVGHYTGISRNGLEARLATHAEGGPDAARLLQVQHAAGGTFHLVSVEWGTQDTETARKYRGASQRCSCCKATPTAPDELPPDLGWVCIVHLDPPYQAGRPGPHGAQPAHCAVFIPGTEAMFTALRRGGRDVAGVVQLPEAHGGTWRLASAEATADRTVPLSERQAAAGCLVCRAAKEQARADELLVAIWRGEVSDRFFAESESWAARWHTRNGRPVVAARRVPGGHLGHNVTLTAAALVRRGLAKQTPVPLADAGEQAKLADRPYQLTPAGQAALPRARARRLSATGLPVTRTGRLCLSKMTNEQRDKAGLMTRAMAREHNALRNLDGNALPGPLCAGASRPGSDEDCIHDSCGDILRGQRPPRRSQRIREMPPPDEWTAPGPEATPVPALAAAVTPQINGQSLGVLADPSWPSTVSDGIRAAVNGDGSLARRARSSRRPPPALTRGASR